MDGYDLQRLTSAICEGIYNGMSDTPEKRRERIATAMFATAWSSDRLSQMDDERLAAWCARAADALIAELDKPKAVTP